MPVYLFDRSEDGEFSRGDYKMEFANLDAACREALRSLAEIAKDELLEGQHRELAIHDPGAWRAAPAAGLAYVANGIR